MFGKQENANSWLSDNQQKLLELFNQLPASEQTRMLDLFEIRLKEIDEYVEQYLRSRQHKKILHPLELTSLLVIPQMRDFLLIHIPPRK